MQLSTLNDLFIDELKDLYSAENQILKALPKMAQRASDPTLQAALNEHERQTRGHVQRLDQVFQKYGQSPTGKVCRGMMGLLQEGDEMLSDEAPPAVMDAGIISMAQRVEHYEIAGYGSVRTYAKELGDKEAQKLLQQTLDEEGETDEKLTKIAEKRVNERALHPAGAAI